MTDQQGTVPAGRVMTCATEVAASTSAKLTDSSGRNGTAVPAHRMPEATINAVSTRQDGDVVLPGFEELQVGPSDHAVTFYRDDAELADQATGYLLDALNNDGSAIVVATTTHELSIERRLTALGADVRAARAAGSYVALDANDTLRRFLIAGWPDPASFWQVISPLIRAARQIGQPVRVFGEMVALLWGADLASAAIELEAMWNEIGRRYSFSLLCAYPRASVLSPDDQDALTEVCRSHSVAYGTPA